MDGVRYGGACHVKVRYGMVWYKFGSTMQDVLRLGGVQHGLVCQGMVQPLRKTGKQ